MQQDCDCLDGYKPQTVEYKSVALAQVVGEAVAAVIVILKRSNYVVFLKNSGSTAIILTPNNALLSVPPHVRDALVVDRPRVEEVVEYGT